MDHTLQPLIGKLSQLLDRLLPAVERLSGADSPAALLLQLHAQAGWGWSAACGFSVLVVAMAVALALSHRYVVLARPARRALQALVATLGLASLLALVHGTLLYNAATEGARSVLRSTGRGLQADALTTVPLWLVLLLHLATMVCVGVLMVSRGRPAPA